MELSRAARRLTVFGRADLTDPDVTAAASRSQMPFTPRAIARIDTVPHWCARPEGPFPVRCRAPASPANSARSDRHWRWSRIPHEWPLALTGGIASSAREQLLRSSDPLRYRIGGANQGIARLVCHQKQGRFSAGRRRDVERLVNLDTWLTFKPNFLTQSVAAVRFTRDSDYRRLTVGRNFQPA